jgi:hypothetical protein
MSTPIHKRTALAIADAPAAPRSLFLSERPDGAPIPADTIVFTDFNPTRLSRFQAEQPRSIAAENEFLFFFRKIETAYFWYSAPA